MVLSHPTKDVENNKGPWAQLWGGERGDGSNLPQATTPGWPHFSVSVVLLLFPLPSYGDPIKPGHWQKKPHEFTSWGQYPTVAITSWMLEGRTWYRDPAPISEIIFRIDLVILCLNALRGFPGGSEVKASACNAGDLGLIPGSGRSPGEGNGNLLQYSCLENPMDGGAWWATVHGVSKSQTRLSDFT